MEVFVEIVKWIGIAFGAIMMIIYLYMVLFALYYGIGHFITNRNSISRRTQVTLSPLLAFLSKSKMLEKRPHLIPSLIAAIMLFAALANWPYGYYSLLRWITCVSAVLVALIALSWAKIWITLLFSFVGLLFNPLIPIHLSRHIWQLTDVICAFMFIAVALILKTPTEKGKN